MTIDQIITRAKGFLLDPVAAFAAARDDGADVLAPYCIVLLLFNAILSALISLAGVTAIALLAETRPGFGMPVIVFFGILVGGAVLTVLFCLWVHLWVLIAGGRKGFPATARAVIYGMTPYALFGWIPVFGFFFSLWAIVLQIIGLKEMQEISSGRALVVMMIAVMVPIIVLVLVAMYLFVSSVSTTPPLNAHGPIFD